MSSLSQFDDGYQPQNAKTPGLDALADGNYDFTIVGAELTTTQKSGETILRMLVRPDGVGGTYEKATFFRSQESVNILGGELVTLGLDADQWTAANKKPFSQMLPRAVGKLAGRRFKGTKKTTSSNGKTYHNLYINAALPSTEGYVPGRPPTGGDPFHAAPPSPGGGFDDPSSEDNGIPF